jgi:hypothetical protein
MVLKAFASEVTRVPVQMHHKFLVQKVHTPTPLVLSPVSLVHRVHFPAKKEVLNAMNVQRGIYNLIRNNQNVIRSKLDQSWPKEDLPPSLYHKGLKLMPLLRPDLQPVQPEQKAARHPMNRVKIARRANPVPKEPPNANRVAKESSVPKMAPPV